MVKIPILRSGQPYESLQTDDVIHFVTGETLVRMPPCAGPARKVAIVHQPQ